jgi:hypothetical protein
MNLISRSALFFCLTFGICLSSCTQQNTAKSNLGATEGKYNLYIMGKDGKEYLLHTNTLDSGSIAPEEQAAPLNTDVIDRDILVKNGFYYHMDRKAGKFVKYTIINKQFQVVSNLPLAQFSIENYRWMGADTLLLTGLKTPEFAQVRYVLLATGSMKIIATGDMNIPKPTGRFDNLSVGFVKPVGNQLLVGYTYHEQLSITDYTTSDTMYVTALRYPQMTALKTFMDNRSTYPGGMNTVQSSSFVDEKQDFYFMACPGIALGNRPELSTAIMKIDQGNVQPNQQYFFNLSKALGNHAYGMWYLGHGRAIVRAERKDLFKGLSDHYSAAHFEFYLVDLESQTVVNKLDLPLDKGTRRECVLLEGDYAYLSINSTTKGNYIWSYNIKTGALKKGLQLSGNTDYILRIDRLK